MISGYVKPYDDAPRARGGSGVALARSITLHTLVTLIFAGPQSEVA